MEKKNKLEATANEIIEDNYGLRTLKKFKDLETPITFKNLWGVCEAMAYEMAKLKLEIEEVRHLADNARSEAIWSSYDGH